MSTHAEEKLIAKFWVGSVLPKKFANLLKLKIRFW